MGTQSNELVARVKTATGLSYRQLGQQIGVSGRTIQRWVSGHSNPIASELHDLAAVVHPTDRALAARIAAATLTSLEALGIEKPASNVEAQKLIEPPRKVEPPPPPTRAQAETVLCAAAEVMDVSPRAIRPALAAAFARAAELGFSTADLARLLAPAPASKTTQG